MGKRFVKINSPPDRKNECVFCDNAKAGELEARFESGESSDIQGVKISVCDKCAEKRGPTLTAFI